MHELGEDRSRAAFLRYPALFDLLRSQLSVTAITISEPKERGNAPIRADLLGGSARINSLTNLGGHSLGYLLGDLGLDDLPNHASRSFHKREFVG
jgi:hypothetical protein